MELLSILGGIALVLIIGYIVSVMGRALMNLARNLLILILASAFLLGLSLIFEMF